MIVGHIGVAIAARGARTTAPLWLLILASQLPDWADALVCSTGVQTTVPGMLTHSLPAVGTLAVMATITAFALTRDFAGSALVGAVVLSHVAGDYVTGVKPTWTRGPTIGLGLYARPLVDFVFEAAIIIAGWLFYRLSFPVQRRTSREVFLVVVVLLAAQAAADILFWLRPGLPKC